MRRALALVLLFAALLAPAASARPNVVVIETDDQTMADLQSMPKTRALIGDEGVSFDQSVVSLSQCCPSRATFLTGRYAHNHGVLTTQPPFGGFPAFADAETLPVWLQRAGYATALVGKYLNQYARTDPSYVPPGWTEWHALAGPTVYRYRDFALDDDGVVHRHPAAYQTDVLTQVAEDVIRRRAGDARPLFLWTTYVAPHVGEPHDVLDVPDMESAVPASIFRDTWIGVPMPMSPAFDEADVTDKPPMVRRKPRLAPWQVDRLEEIWRQRQEALQSVDDGVERLVRALRAAGALDDTLLVFTSDNGYLIGEHRFKAGKIQPYEPSIRVPLLVRGPGIPRGRTSEQLVWNGDLAPTILDAAGATPAWEPDGRSLLPFARDPAVHEPRSVLLEGVPVSKVDPTPGFTGLRTERYKYVERQAGGVELYDLARDPDELDDLAGTPAVADVQRTLSARLARLRRCQGTGCR
jgi:N-acetylglucosamine-6-sulfatase